jgi:glutathione S-transferase
MKLYNSPTSPYGRKCMVVAIEHGLAPRIQLLNADLQKPNQEFLNANPLGKIPALITDDGMCLPDSKLIAEYLDSIGKKAKLFPAAGPERWRALSQMMVADGLTDAMILRRQDSLRPAAQQSTAFQEKQKSKVDQSLAALEQEAASGAFEGDLTIGQVAVISAIGYLELRMPEDPWRTRYPKLADWARRFAARPSIRATEPPKG